MDRRDTSVGQMDRSADTDVDKQALTQDRRTQEDAQAGTGQADIGQAETGHRRTQDRWTQEDAGGHRTGRRTQDRRTQEDAQNAGCSAGCAHNTCRAHWW